MIFKEVKGKLRSSSHYYVPAEKNTLKVLKFFLGGGGGGIIQSGPRVGIQRVLYYILYTYFWPTL